MVPHARGSVDEGLQLAAARHKRDAWEETCEFSGLAVQAVGYEEGKEDAGVVVYVTKGSARRFGISRRRSMTYPSRS